MFALMRTYMKCIGYSGPWITPGSVEDFFDVPQGEEQKRKEKEHRWQKPRRPDKFLLFVQVQFLFKGPQKHLFNLKETSAKFRN